MKSILQDFLTAQIIHVDEDENHGKLLKAASDLEKVFQKDKRKIQKIAIIAFDPDIDPNEPLIEEVQKLIIKYWSTFVNKCQDPPISYIRAVMLQALQSGSKDVVTAGIIWLTISSYTRFLRSGSRETAFLNELLQACGEKFERYCSESWQIKKDNSAYVPSTRERTDGGAVGGIKKEWLVEKMKAAAGDNTVEGYNSQIIGTNPSYGNVNIKQDWASRFGTMSGETISIAFDTFAKQVNKVMAAKANIEDLAVLTAEFTNSVEQLLNARNGAILALNLRNELIWYKETLYSSIERKGLREIDPPQAAVLVALEIGDLLPPFTPTNVQYFVAETCRAISNSFDQATTFEDALVGMSSLSDSVRRHECWKSIKYSGDEKGTLLSFLSGLIAGSTTIASLEDTIGIRANSDIRLSEISTWLFKEFQTEKLIKLKQHE